MKRRVEKSDEPPRLGRMTLSCFRYIHSLTLLVSAAVAMAQKQPVPAIAYSEVQQLLEGDSDEVIVEKAAKLLPQLVTVFLVELFLKT